MECIKSFGLLACGLFGLTTIAAHASEQGFYVGATVSRVKQHAERSAGIAIAVPGITFATTQADSLQVDTNNNGWSATLGYRVNRYLAGEIAYSDFGSADVSEHYTFPDLFLFPLETFENRYSIRVKGPSLSGLGRLPIGTNWSVFLRGGVLFADETITHGSSFDPTSMTFGNNVMIGGAGVEWSFFRRWTARVEYQRTGNIESNIVAGKNRLDQISFGVLFGP